MAIPFHPPEPVNQIALAQQAGNAIDNTTSQLGNAIQQNQPVSSLQKWIAGVQAGHVSGKDAAILHQLEEAGHTPPELQPHHIAAEMNSSMNGPQAPDQTAQSAQSPDQTVQTTQSVRPQVGPPKPEMVGPPAPRVQSPAPIQTAQPTQFTQPLQKPPVTQAAISAPPIPSIQYTQSPQTTQPPIRTRADFEEFMKYAPQLGKAGAGEDSLLKTLIIQNELNKRQKEKLDTQGDWRNLDRKEKIKHWAAALNIKEDVATKQIDAANERVRMIVDERADNHKKLNEWRKKIDSAKDKDSAIKALGQYTKVVDNLRNNLRSLEANSGFSDNPEQTQKDINKFRTDLDKAELEQQTAIDVVKERHLGISPSELKTEESDNAINAEPDITTPVQKTELPRVKNPKKGPAPATNNSIAVKEPDPQIADAIAWLANPVNKNSPHRAGVQKRLTQLMGK